MIKSLIAALAVSTLSMGPAPAVSKESATKVIHVCSKKDNPIDSLACNIYMESRGENITVQMAVGFVTLNRSKHEKFPEKIRDVVYQSSQFSWTKLKTSYKVTEPDSWKVARDLSRFLYKIKDNEALYKRLDPTDGSTFFHSTQIKPYWRKYFSKTVTLGSLIFYKFREDNQ